MTFDTIRKKLQTPPSAHNFVRLIDPASVEATTKKIVAFALSKIIFNYIPATNACIDRVRLELDLHTAIKSVSERGNPHGRVHNQSIVQAFYEHDEVRGYSNAKFIDSYHGQFRVARDLIVPTKPTFTIYENGHQIPVLLCGWSSIPFSDLHFRLLISILESGLFTHVDYANSPWEMIFASVGNDNKPSHAPSSIPIRSISTVSRGDFNPLSSTDLRELMQMYLVAKEAALPIAYERWKKRQDLPATEHPTNDIRSPSQDQLNLFS